MNLERAMKRAEDSVSFGGFDDDYEEDDDE